MKVSEGQIDKRKFSLCVQSLNEIFGYNEFVLRFSTASL